MAHLLGGAAAPPTPRDLACAGAALSRSDGGVSQNLGALPGWPGFGNGNAAHLHLYDDLAVLPDFEGRGDVLHRDAPDDRHRPDRNPSAAARKALARSDV